MKKIYVSTLFLLFAFSLSACTSGALTASSWPGISQLNNETVFVAFGPNVYALDAQTGSVQWKFPVEGDEQGPFYADPALTPDGQLLTAGYDNVLYSLNPQTGQPNGWRFEGAKNRFVGSPLATEEAIFAPSSDGTLYTLDHQGNLIWEFPTDQPQWVQPVTNGGKLFVASLDHHVYALNAQNGNEIWKKDMGSAVVGIPTFNNDGVLFAGTFGGDLYALDTNVGEPIWNITTEGRLWSGPALKDNSIYIGDGNGVFYALRADDGFEQWRLESDGAIYGRPLIAGEIVYFATDAGTLYAVDTEGREQWKKSITGKIYAEPVSVGELIIVGANEGDSLITAFDKDGTVQWRFNPET